MTVTLRDAIMVLEERKRAMGVEPPFSPGDQIDLRPLLIGTDLDHDELEEVIARLVQSSAMFLGPVLGPVSAGFVGGAWLDGLVVGLTLADLRARDTSAVSEDGDG